MSRAGQGGSQAASRQRIHFEEKCVLQPITPTLLPPPPPCIPLAPADSPPMPLGRSLRSACRSHRCKAFGRSFSALPPGCLAGCATAYCLTAYPRFPYSTLVSLAHEKKTKTKVVVLQSCGHGPTKGRQRGDTKGVLVPVQLPVAVTDVVAA